MASESIGSASHVVWDGDVDELRRMAQAACGRLLWAPYPTLLQSDDEVPRLRRCKRCLALVKPELGTVPA